MNREQLTTQVNIGKNAERLLADELLSGLIFSKKNSACEAFMSTLAGDDSRRTELWRSVQGIIDIERELIALVDSGNIAKDQLNLLDEEDRLTETNVHNFFNGDT